MRYIIPLILAAFLSMGFLGGEAEANNQCNCAKCQQARYGFYQQRQPQQNVFQKLMELERRKNAWLRRTFLGKN